MYLILLLAVFVLTGVFAVQNDGTQVFTLLGYTWSLPTWAPTVIGVSAMSVLLMLHMSHARVGSQLRTIGYDRTVDEHRDRLDDLRDENVRLREALAAARGEIRGVRGVVPQRSWMDSIRSLPGRFSRRSTT